MENYDLIPKDARILELDADEIKALKGTYERQDVGDIESLAESIRDNGQLQPVTVRLVQKEGKSYYLIVAGRRRRAACKKLGIKVKCVVVEPQDLSHILDLQIAENVDRKDFDLLEMSEILLRRKEEYEKAGKTSEEGAARFTLVMARKLQVSEGTVRKMMNPLRIPSELREQISCAESTEVRNNLVRQALAEIEQQKNLDKIEDKIKKAKSKCLKTPANEAQASVSCTIHEDTLDTLPTILKDRYVDALITVHPPHLKSSEWLEGVQRFLSKNANVLVLCPSLETLLLYKELKKPSWLKFIGEIVWVQYDAVINRKKHNNSGVWYIAHLNGEKNYPFYGKGLPNYVRGNRLLEEDALPDGGSGSAFVEGVRKPDDEFLGLDEYQVPLWLTDHLVGSFTAEGDVLLDPFMRSGSFVLSGVQMKRVVVGCETDKQLVWIAKQRIEASEDSEQ